MNKTVRQIATAYEGFFWFDTSATTENCPEGPAVGPSTLENDVCTQLARRSVRRRTDHSISAVGGLSTGLCFNILVACSPVSPSTLS